MRAHMRTCAPTHAHMRAHTCAHARPHAPVRTCTFWPARAHRGRDFDTRPLSVSNAPLTSPVKRGRPPPAPIDSWCFIFKTVFYWPPQPWGLRRGPNHGGSAWPRGRKPTDTPGGAVGVPDAVHGSAAWSPGRAVAFHERLRGRVETLLGPRRKFAEPTAKLQNKC